MVTGWNVNVSCRLPIVHLLQNEMNNGKQLNINQAIQLPMLLGQQLNNSYSQQLQPVATLSCLDTSFVLFFFVFLFCFRFP